MQKILPALIFYLVIKPISLLPYSVIYLISNFLCFILEYIIQYRKEVIFTNLKNSFPEKNEKELKIIQKKFYIHFSDIILESIKSFNLTEKEARKRIKYENLELVNKIYENGKDVLILSGHYGNWEMAATTIPLFIKHDVLGIYKSLKNEYFDNLIKVTRSKFGLKLFPMEETKEALFKKLNRPKGIIFLTDQTPSNPARSHWTTFLNQDTPVFLGAERYAKILDIPLVYMSVIKTKRGHFTVKCRMLFENSKETKKGEITEKHVRTLEQDIRDQPEYWLWSHKRWKHKRND